MRPPLSRFFSFYIPKVPTVPYLYYTRYRTIYKRYIKSLLDMCLLSSRVPAPGFLFFTFCPSTGFFIFYLFVGRNFRHRRHLRSGEAFPRLCTYAENQKKRHAQRRPAWGRQAQEGCPAQSFAAPSDYIPPESGPP